jgi:50S ribosome-binding GTPase
MSDLVVQTRALLRDSAMALANSREGSHVAAVAARFDEPVRVALAGRVKAGKSTLLNALLGESLAPTDASECTRVVTWYRHGSTPKVLASLTNGATPIELPFRRSGGALDVDFGSIMLETIDRLEVQWPIPALRDIVLIDTPGVDSLSAGASDRTMAALAPKSDRVGDADVVVYLLRHMHGADVGFLEAFRTDDFGPASAVSCVGVLARADEVGVARLDALEQAARVARRYSTDRRMRRMCQTVLPIAGLLAEGSNTVTHQDFVVLGQLAALAADYPDLVLDADTFVQESDRLSEPSVEIRSDLLRRVGLFGVRRSIDALRRGEVDSSVALARFLRHSSGIETLTDTLRSGLSRRRDLLKVRAALSSLAGLLGPGSSRADEPLVVRLEALTAQAHELREARLVEALRCADIDFSETEIDRAEQLLGAAVWPNQLGIDDEPAPDQRRDVIDREIAFWRRKAESPFTGREGADAANVLVRTVEGFAERARVQADGSPVR